MPLKRGYKKLNLLVEERLFNLFKAAAAMRGETMTTVILNFIHDYVHRYGPQPAAERSRRNE